MKERRQVSDFQKIKGVNERQAILLQWLNEDPDALFTVKEIQTRMSVSNQTARTDLEGLQSAGFLEGIELNKKLKGFCKSGDFEKLINQALE